MSKRRRLFDGWDFDDDPSKGSDDGHPLAGYVRLLDRIIIGNIAFGTEAAEAATRRRVAACRDEDEIYWIAERFLPQLADRGLLAAFEPICFCGGIFTIGRSDDR